MTMDETRPTIGLDSYSLEPDPRIARLTYYRLVPKTLSENILFRQSVLDRCRWDREKQHDVWVMCSRDPLFFLNLFGWTYDPRKSPARRPFMTYEFQDTAFLMILSCIGRRDLVIEKTRDMGASWLYLVAFLWCWLFREGLTFLVASRKVDLVDKFDNPDSLFAKLDFFIAGLPRWMMPPDWERKYLSFVNRTMGTTIDGESTTGDLARGGRRTGLLVDEFASVPDGYAIRRAVEDVTKNVGYLSTPKGTGNAYYDLAQDPSKQRLRLMWYLHPEKNQNLRLDADGNVTSDWMEEQLDRRSAIAVAQEIKIDYHASGSAYFDGAALDRIQERDVRAPLVEMSLKELMDKLGLELTTRNSKASGVFRMWHYLGVDEAPPTDRTYSLGCDVSAGSDASNSVGTIGDCRLQETIAELATIYLLPFEFAQVMIALGKWYRGEDAAGLLIWESNGPGQEFGTEVKEAGYPHMYFRRKEVDIRERVTLEPGWPSSKTSKARLLGELREGWAQGTFTSRALEMVKEAREYQHGPDGTVVHPRRVHSEDPSGAGSNHGDRVISGALCLRGMQGRAWTRPKASHAEMGDGMDYDFKTGRSRSTGRVPPSNTMAGRRYERLQAATAGGAW